MYEKFDETNLRVSFNVFKKLHHVSSSVTVNVISYRTCKNLKAHCTMFTKTFHSLFLKDVMNMTVSSELIIISLFIDTVNLKMGVTYTKSTILHGEFQVN